MRDRAAHWESSFKKMCILRDACRDPQAALYVIAYLVAGKSDDQLDDVLTALQEWQAGNKPQTDLHIAFGPRD